MFNAQENKRSMYITIKDVLSKSKQIWNSLPAFQEAVNEFETTIANIDIQRLIQEGKTTGISEDKQKLSTEMMQLTNEFASTIFAYASKTGNNELMKKVSYSPSKLTNARDTILKDICQLVHSEATNIIAQLADYGKTQADLEKLSKAIDNFNTILAKPRTAIALRKTATTKLVELFKNGDNILKNRLDKLVENFQQSQPKFYKEYKTARIIINTGSQTIALSVLINDKNGNPIPNASAKITNIPNNKAKDIINEISKKTGTSGTFRILNLVEGNYKITIKKIGYVEKSLNFTVVNGETTKINTTLESVSSPEIQ